MIKRLIIISLFVVLLGALRAEKKLWDFNFINDKEDICSVIYKEVSEIGNTFYFVLYKQDGSIICKKLGDYDGDDEFKPLPDNFFDVIS